jgi:hypothetical protein
MSETPKKKAPKKRISRLTHAEDVLQNLLQNSNTALSDQYTRWKVWKDWKVIAGPTIASQSEPVGYNHKTLIVWVKSSAMAQELRFFEAQLIENINKMLQKVWITKIRFSLDRHNVDSVSADQIKSWSKRK